MCVQTSRARWEPSAARSWPAQPEAVPWFGPPADRPPIAAPLVLTDLSVPPADAAILAATARVLSPTCDALLVG